MPDVILYGPESIAYDTYAAQSPAPPSLAPFVGAGQPPAIIGVRPDGTQLCLQDGRKFRFARAGGSTLVIGNVLTAGVATASQQNLTAAVGAINDRVATMTTGASTSANVFAQGFLVVSVTPGGGDAYKIASHLLMTSAAGDIVNFWPGQALRRATTTSSKYDLIDNSYSRVIQSPATTLASAVVGVAVTAPTTLRGCWVQTRGPCGILGAGTLIAGTRAVAGSSVAGSAAPETATAATSKLEVTIGICIFAAADTAWSTVFLTLDG